MGVEDSEGFKSPFEVIFFLGSNYIIRRRGGIDGIRSHPSTLREGYIQLTLRWYTWSIELACNSVLRLDNFTRMGLKHETGLKGF